MSRRVAATLAAICLSLVAAPVDGHFPWLVVEPGGRVLYFFGENLAERTYKLPPGIAKANVRTIGENGKTKKIAFREVTTDDFVGLASIDSIEKDRVVLSEATYGLYHGSCLKYYARHQAGKLPTGRRGLGSSELHLPLDVELVDNGSGIDVYVVWKGKPLAGADVHLFCEEGHEEGTAATDKQGKVSFDSNQVEDGLNGIMVGHTVKGEAGEFDGERFESTSHYLTATFLAP